MRWERRVRSGVVGDRTRTCFPSEKTRAHSFGVSDPRLGAGAAAHYHTIRSSPTPTGEELCYYAAHTVLDIVLKILCGEKYNLR